MYPPPPMASIITFRQHEGMGRTWVPRADEDWWLRFWARQGVPAVLLSDYRRWGGFFPPATDPGWTVMLRRAGLLERR